MRQQSRGHDWPPILSAVESPTGVWSLTAQYADEPYGVVEIRRTAEGIRYRASLYGQELGRATTLALALERVHGAYIRTLGRDGGAVASWGDRFGAGRD